MGFFKKEKNKKQSRIRRTLIVTSALALFMSFAPAMANNSVVDSAFGIETAYAGTAQSDRWVDAGNSVWKLKTSDNQGYVSNSWFQDLDGSWYMIGSDGAMLSGLITDQSTGKSYLLNLQHDGTFGRMLTVDGVYNLNGVNVHLTFNQKNDGTFGAILSGLDSVRSSGVSEKALASIPTDSAGGGTGTAGGPAGGQVQKPEVPQKPLPEGTYVDENGLIVGNIAGESTGIGGSTELTPEILEKLNNSTIIR